MRDKLLKIESFSDFFKRKKKSEPGTESTSLGLEVEPGFTAGYRTFANTESKPISEPEYQSVMFAN
jgi:hypothetical protein